jgi:cation transport ATPase
LIDAEAKAKENRNRETDQRYVLRWVAVICACLLIIGMATMLWHLAHWTVGNPGNAPASFIVAIFVAPILSMTTLALALLVAAFRGYKDSDEATGATLASQGMKATGMMQ